MLNLSFSPWALLAQDGSAAAGAAVEQVAQTASSSGTLLLVFALLVFVVPFILGTLVAKMLKLKDVAGRLTLVFFALFMGATPMMYQVAKGNSWKDCFSLGIDLAGGTNLVYQLDAEEAKRLDKPIDGQLIQNMVGAIIRRINPSGTEEVTVRQVGMDRIEVIIPGDDPELVQQKKNAMTRLGSLEFSIVANQKRHARIISAAQDVADDVREDGRVVASWKRVAGEEIQSGEGRLATRPIMRDGEQVGQEVLVIVEPNEDRRITGRYLTRAYPTQDENGAPAVGFTFNQRGGFLFQALTSANRPDAEEFFTHLAILLDNEVHSAPRIQTTISDQGQISGRFTQDEITELINVLNAGALEVPFTKNPVTNKPEPISENTISPTLGVDVQQKGIFAIAVSGIAVLFFMMFYYRTAGLISDLCLLMNLVLILGTMALIAATFTLPGLAGLVLTIGMAVDANVLIYERMREEQSRGSSLRMTIQNGFGKALSAIIDSNITTLITAVILYLIGTDQVKGFAVTLFIGIVMTLFSVLVFGRLLFEIGERKRWITQLNFTALIGETKFDFLSKQKLFVAVSILLILAGFAGLGARGQENLDIDFSGGTMVTFELEESANFDDVRSHIVNAMGMNISLERLVIEGEAGEGKSIERYRLRTTEQNVTLVREQVVDAFKDGQFHLRRVTMTYSEPTAVAGDDAPAKFVGGHRTTIDLSSPVKIVTLTDQLSEAITRLSQSEGGAVYDEPSSLFEVIGLEEGKPAATGAGSATSAFKQVQVTAIQDLKEADFQSSLKSMQDDMASTPLFDEVNSFASSIADEMKESALLAMVASGLAVVAYLWFRFSRATFGIAAIVAVFHDVLVVMGMIALGSYLGGTTVGQALGFTDFKFNMTIVAALMTIIGYSLNDTIVIFDRIREVRGKNPALTADMINLSVNQTLSRTILTSVTTTIVVIILYVFGGEGIHGFAYAMLVGMVAGTYSTVFIANPVLLWLMNRPGSATAMAGAPKARTKEGPGNAAVSAQ
ncbi:MAG: protein translocase subunit SecD [Planctomycetota bacterium]|nr:protein translocase subunit SecD [Planctomycetota bacterium]MDA1211988.1 protein translocase subunit SecD [Planctomycetota bacterium]